MPASQQSSRWLRSAGYLIAILVLVISLLARLPRLSAPLTGPHDFRQTQTAITIWTFLTDKIQLFRYKTPVFGAPWRAPFEFPLYQAIVTLVIRAFGTDIESTSRVVSIAFFYATAIVLFALIKHLARSTACAVCVVLIYVLQPLSIVWSSSCTIESCAAFFTWLFVLAWIKSLSPADLPRPGWRGFVWPAIAIVAGVLAALVKITTLAPVAALLAATAIAHLREARERKQVKPALARLLLFVGPSILAGAAWSSYTDAVRAAAPATLWLTGERTHRFLFGTLDQRLDGFRWEMIGTRITDYACPGLLLALVVIGLLWAAQRRDQLALLAWMSVVGIVLPIVVFFNLYVVHEYYLVAVMPLFAILGGFGLYFGLTHVRGAVSRIVFVLALVGSLGSAFPYVKRFYNDVSGEPRVRVAAVVAKATDPRDQILIAGEDWHPGILYHARRRGLMFRELYTPYNANDLKKVTCLVVRQRNAVPATWYPHRKLLSEVSGYFIYRVEFSDLVKP